MRVGIGVAGADGEFAGPAAGDRVEWVAGAGSPFRGRGRGGFAIEFGGDAVLDAGAEERFAREVDLGRVAGGGGDFVGAGEFGVGVASEDVLDFDGGEGD